MNNVIYTGYENISFWHTNDRNQTSKSEIFTVCPLAWESEIGYIDLTETEMINHNIPSFYLYFSYRTAPVQYSIKEEKNIKIFIEYLSKRFFYCSGMFQQVGEFVVDKTGKYKLLLSNDSIIWPNNSSAPSSDVLQCRSCDARCYNGKAYSCS